MNKHLIPTLLCLSFISLTGCSQNKGEANTTDNTQQSDSTIIMEQKKQQVTMAFVGDVMMGTNFPSEEFVTKDRGRSLFVDCKDILQRADIAIANLEGTCYDGTEGELRKMTNPNTYYIFRMPGDHAQNLVDAGFDVVNCANNHSFDFGMTGRVKTLETMEKAGIAVSGVRDLAEGCVVEREGIKIGYVSFAASCTKVNDMLDYEEVERLVKKYREQCDLLVVGFHGGAEGSSFTHVPMKEEYYVGEDRGDVHRFAHFCIDHGADIVVGHGPHVPRALELYNGHLIAYSLGNFCGPYRLGCSGLAGHAPLLEAVINTSDGTFAEGQIHSFIGHRGIGPRKDNNNLAASDIRQLTKQDFPTTPLVISESGKISKKQEQED